MHGGAGWDLDQEDSVKPKIIEYGTPEEARRALELMAGHLARNALVDYSPEQGRLVLGGTKLFGGKLGGGSMVMWVEGSRILARNEGGAYLNWFVTASLGFSLWAAFHSSSSQGMIALLSLL